MFLFLFLFHSFLFFSPFACVRVFNGPCSYRSRHLRGFHATISVTDWLDTLHPQETAMALPGGYILWAWVGLSLQFPLPSLLTCRNEDDMIDNMPVWHCSYAADHYSTLGCRWSSDAMNKYQTSVIGCYNVSRSQCRCHNVGNAS